MSKNDDDPSLEQALQVVAAGTTLAKKLVSGDFSGLLQTFSNVVQDSLKADFFSAFINERERLIKEGKSSVNFGATDIGKLCLLELMDALSEGLPDKGRFDALKALYFKAADVSSDEAQQARVLQLMKACRTLDSSEILILRTSFNIYKNHPATSLNSDAQRWPENIEAASEGLLTAGIVELYENRLIDKGIITERVYPDKSGYSRGSFMRLTRLGIELGTMLQL